MTRAALILIGLLATVGGGLFAAYVPSNRPPPAPPREFRGAWVASVANIDWPSRRGLGTEQQQAELLAILDRAARLRLNAIILQVRPACDALYDSKLEPWSEYLTGAMGQAPKPFYDPLVFAVAEAHQRGLELHAWFNPFRARHPSGKSAATPNHISQTRPALVKSYGRQLWLDPGEPAAVDHSLAVILDVVRRYDVDGVHLDDYFYPYPVKDVAGMQVDFPDSASWSRYRTGGGQLSRDDWRRQNVDTFIERLYRAIKEAKPRVKFGVSPFGIWRPGHPAQIRGFDAYAQIYADSRKWLSEGWLDYFAPQLYWATADKEQSFPVLLKWWAEQNRRQRHLWPGISHGHAAEEIVKQIHLTRGQSGAGGNIHWSVKALVQNRRGVADLLPREAYAQPALVPATPWLDRLPPPPPKLNVNGGNGRLTLRWEPVNGEPAWLWLVQTRTGGAWANEIVPCQERSRVLDAQERPEIIAVSAVDRCGNIGPPAVLEKQNGSRR
jgi:uncharacterized lipoprotein YddW (UPF0748 family)